MSRAHRLVVIVFLSFAAVSVSGCATYWANRGNDLLDFAEMGVTVTDKPEFAAYIGFLDIVSLGYTDWDGTLYGLGPRAVGAFDAHSHATGYLVWGKEQFAYPPAGAEEQPLPESWRAGFMGVILGPRPPKHEVVNCPKVLHLGWVGVMLHCHVGELADLLLGFTTLDIMGDDH